MHFVDRDFVCERLKVSQWASYRLLYATSMHYIKSTDVIALLNRSRHREQEIDYIPSDIVTADELEKESGIPARKLLLWTRRQKKTIPHYRFNKQTTRFRIKTAMEWLERHG